MIGVIWRAPRTGAENELYEKFKQVPGIVSSVQLASATEVVVVTVWESAASRDAYMRTTLQQEIATANPRATREVLDVLAATF